MSETAQPGRILVVDDDAPLLEAYVDTLSRAGYEVVAAPDTQKATEALRHQVFDAVLTDIIMPDGSGVDVLRAARERDLDLPVLLITGSPSVESAVQALELGALRYLLKPVTAVQLLAGVQSAVRLRRLAALERAMLQHRGLTDRLVGDLAGLEASFRRALGSLHMAYQPIVSASGGHIFGYEALLRCNEPTVPNPRTFLRTAERLGRPQELGRLIRASVAETKSRLATGHPFFVNLHAQDFFDENLYSREAPLSPFAHEVVLEITERTAVEEIPDLRQRAQSLREMGFRLAVDDLGAGYAGVGTLARLEPNFVKLDRDLVKGIDSEPYIGKLVGSFCALFHEHGIQVVAEGIETAGEGDTLTRLGCDLLQGYLYGRPGPIGRVLHSECPDGR
jgi:EAL domain-containing protein (putative c-di-GMP-specific phosphodiesterase class I)